MWQRARARGAAAGAAAGRGVRVTRGLARRLELLARRCLLQLLGDLRLVALIRQLLIVLGLAQAVIWLGDGRCRRAVTCRICNIVSATINSDYGFLLYYEDHEETAA